MSKLREIVKKCPGVRPAGIALRSTAQSAWRTFRRVLAETGSEGIGSLRNIHHGQRACIVGNGPSLKELDLSILNGEITFACNKIWLLFDRTDWRPTYYVVEDDLLAMDNAEAINNLRGVVKVFPRDLKHLLLPDDHTVYVDFVRGEYLGFPRFSDRCDRQVYWGGTVTYMMLQLACWMGCNPIYLIGQDMDYKAYASADGKIITSSEPDLNHFDPGYFGPGQRWHVPNVERMVRCLSYAWRHLSARNVKVYNATRGGKLEVFPRVVYEDAFR